MSKFRIIAFSPVAVHDSSTAIAASRAGHNGGISLEYCSGLQIARQIVSKARIYGKKPVCLKIGDVSTGFLVELVSEFNDFIHTVLFANSCGDKQAESIKLLKKQNIEVLREISSVSDLDRLRKTEYDGIVAKGCEAGGIVGEATSFILLQQVVGKTKAPVYVYGGVGIHTIGACYLAGARGAVLDSQFLLAKESRLPDDIKKALGGFDGSHVRSIRLGNGRHFACFGGARSDILRTIPDLPNPKRGLIRQILGKIGWHSIEHDILPVGQDAAFSRNLAEKYHTVGGIIAGLLQNLEDRLAAVHSASFLSPASPLAEFHRISYPIFQGPMTRVSDEPAFAREVAVAGGLPFIALAMMKGDEAGALLQKTSHELGEYPWGAGLLGFIDQELFREQADLVIATRPDCVLLAGGKPEQAELFESNGLPAYLHVPSPALLKLYIDAGCRHFIFEGRECGGHVGPRSSLVLWNSMVDELLRVCGADLSAYHCIFAGGIHDELSSAMLAAIASPLSQKGARVGVMVGTAYLFTREIVASNAIVKHYQDASLSCSDTVLIESGRGHVVRCCPSPFIDMFEQEKARLIGQQTPASYIREQLDALNIGRLRLASKGKTRNETYREGSSDQKFREVNQSAQFNNGLYMIGQAATMHDRVIGVKDLHKNIIEDARTRIARVKAIRPPAGRSRAAKPSDIAIVGMSCLMPQAADAKRFWHNVLNKKDCISEIPPHRWDWRLYHTDQGSHVADKVVSKWGGFIDPILFDPVKYGMPPSTLRSIEPVQLLSLEAVDAALGDAGYAAREFNREKTSVIFGVTGGSAELGQQYITRALLPAFADNKLRASIDRNLPEWTEDSFAGILPNVIAGRISNRFNFGGLNYTVDAACASSLAGIYLAVRELENGTSDVVVAGGADTFQSPFTYLCFSQTHALAPDGRCKTFDSKADGTSVSEGIGVVVLKRLKDAERDGDRIYAVIKGISGSSDGRARGLTAPHPAGQQRAFRRAYEHAGYPPDTVELIEAHGTGTVAGDKAEIASLCSIFEESGSSRKSVALNSVKSVIGHSKGCAGVAGLIKIALALHHKVLPPTLHVKQPNSALLESPFYVNSNAKPWVRSNNPVPRRAGVSGFGFGGTNFHATLEEYRDDYLGDAAATLDVLPTELCILPAGLVDEAVSRAKSLLELMAKMPSLELKDIASSLWYTYKPQRGKCAAIIASSCDDLKEKLHIFIAGLVEEEVSQLVNPKGIYYFEQSAGPGDKLAILFSGQGSQYPYMLKDVAMQFPVARGCFDTANSVLHGTLESPLSSYIYPPSAFSPDDEKAQKKKLAQTHLTQPALAAADIALYRLLNQCDIAPDMVAGHSFGEFAALHAAGVYGYDDFCRIAAARGAFITEEAHDAGGAMFALKTSLEPAREIVDKVENAWLANINAPAQIIVSCAGNAIEALEELCRQHEVTCRPIPVSCAFHSPLVAPAGKRLAAFLRKVKMQAPHIPVYSNCTARPYPAGVAALKKQLAAHLTSPVRFAEQIRAMYDAGARIFIEAGPNQVLTNLVQQILADDSALIVASDVSGKHGVTQVQQVVGQCLAYGVNANADVLFANRQCKACTLAGLAAEARPAPTPATAWKVDGGGCEPLHAPAKNPPSSQRLSAKRRQSAMATQHGPECSGSAPPRDDDATTDLPVAAQSGYDPYPLDEISAHAEKEEAMQLNDDSNAQSVMVNYQKLMAHFLETQQKVMMAYLNGGETPAPSILSSETLTPMPEISINHSTSPAQHSATAQPAAPAPASPQQDIPVEAESADQPHTHSPDAEKKESATAFTFDQVKAAVLDVVSDRTGYPADMLDLECDIEASLGIDSIKRIEIIGALREKFPQMNGDGALATMRSLNELINGIQSICQSTTAHAAGHTSMDTTRANAQEPQHAVGGESIEEKLLEIISEKTGYPIDMLGLDLDLEAELGIDSIKRVEIVGALRQLFPVLQQEAARKTDLTALRTLREMQETLLRLAGSAAPAEVPAETAEKKN
ncbi:MAG: acyltransferase domain-containing protein [Chitinivibrionales bacterium]|nr:acyltransferase domain-containing protein [Chitinivibrionales bacterium]